MSHPHSPALQNDLASGTEVTNTTADPRHRLVVESLTVDAPRRSSQALQRSVDPDRECHLELPVDEIDFYEHNPRRAANARFDEIKASIKADGMRVPLAVTRRPGEIHFIVEAGGNTRLRAVRELWRETGESRFATLTVLFRPWRSESHVLSAHLIENEQRGDMSFWDKACALEALKRQLERENEQVLSLRGLVDLLQARGLLVNPATLSNCLYAARRLRTLGDRIPVLSGLDVRTLQPRLNALLQGVRDAADYARIYASVFEPVFESVAAAYEQTGRFDIRELVARCEAVYRNQAPAAGISAGVSQEEPNPPTPNDSGMLVEGSPATPGRPDVPRMWHASPRGGGVARLSVLCGRLAKLGRYEWSELAIDATPLPPSELPEAVRSRLNDAVSRRLLALVQGIERQGPEEDAVVLDQPLLQWLCDPREPVAVLFWEIIGELRTCQSQRPASDGGSA